MKLSVIIIAKNEEKIITDCLKSVSWADEIVVVDDCSQDKTMEIAKENGAKVYVHKMEDFARQREFGLKKAKGEWILYLDADERATKELKSEILALLKAQDSRHKISSLSSEVGFNSSDGGTAENIVAYKIPRKNFYFGRYEWPTVEKIERLFLKKALKGWKGPIHESPIIKGEVGELKNYLLHYTHQDLSSMVKKTNEWSEIEAQMLYKAGHPKMTWWRFLRVMMTKFWQSYISQGGWKIGTPGLIESIYQGYSYFIVYTKLWEKQNENRNL